MISSFTNHSSSPLSSLSGITDFIGFWKIVCSNIYKISEQVNLNLMQKHNVCLVIVNIYSPKQQHHKCNALVYIHGKIFDVKCILMDDFPKFGLINCAYVCMHKYILRYSTYFISSIHRN